MITSTRNRMNNIKFATEKALILGKHKRKKKCHSKFRSQFPGVSIPFRTNVQENLCCNSMLLFLVL
jgi:hypothetical protein